MHPTRKSLTELNKIYFFTATIHKWLPLLETLDNKVLLTGYLKELSEKHLIKVYAFVIMRTNALRGGKRNKPSWLVAHERKHSSQLILHFPHLNPQIDRFSAGKNG